MRTRLVTSHVCVASSAVPSLACDRPEPSAPPARSPLLDNVIIDAMRNAFSGHYLNAIMLEGVAVSIGLAAMCLWIAARAFVRENA